MLGEGGSASLPSHFICATAPILRAKLAATMMGAAMKANTPRASQSAVAPSREAVPLTSCMYTLDKKRRRVLAGLTPEETTEFELLDAQFPLDDKPAWRPSDLPLSPKKQRWLELFRRIEAARKQTAA